MLLTAIQPARQPGARYAFDSDENVMTGASGIAGGNRRHRAVEREVGVDLVGEQRKVVAIGQLDERAADLGRIGRAGRVVRIDDDQRARRRGDQAAHVIDVGHPAAIGVGAVKHRARADLGEHGRVQWIGRYRDQHFVARLGERGQRQLNPFRRARRDDHAIGRDRHAPPVALGGDRFAGRQDADRRRVAILARRASPARPLQSGAGASRSRR